LCCINSDTFSQAFWLKYYGFKNILAFSYCVSAFLRKRIELTDDFCDGNDDGGPESVESFARVLEDLNQVVGQWRYA
jgi:hypothetical protein